MPMLRHGKKTVDYCSGNGKRNVPVSQHKTLKAYFAVIFSIIFEQYMFDIVPGIIWKQWK